ENDMFTKKKVFNNMLRTTPKTKQDDTYTQKKIHSRCQSQDLPRILHQAKQYLLPQLHQGYIDALQTLFDGKGILLQVSVSSTSVSWLRQRSTGAWKY
ncbi:unnamed protein product, partial [Prorocentrum cordatum]